MAVTINTLPQEWSPSDNPITFRFSSNQTGQANFSYLVKTYYNSNLVSTDVVYPEVGIYAHWDASPIIKNLLTTPTRKTALWQNSATNGNVYIVVTESYGTPATLQASATSSTVQVFKACLSDVAWSGYDYTDYKNLLFLTNYPRTEQAFVQRGSDVYLNLIQDASKQLEIKLYTANGTLLDTYTNTQNYKIAQINTNTSLLESTAGFTSGDIASASYYTVQVGTSEIFTFYFYDDYCGTIQSLQWMNEWGAFDSFVFAHNLELSGSVTDRKYNRSFGGWSGSTFTYDLEDAGEVRIGTQQKDSGTIYTSWISQAQQNWLTELYKSPRFVLTRLGESAVPIRITSNQFTFKQQRFEELVNESVSFEFVNNHNGLSL